jgi:hypothetical protein
VIFLWGNELLLLLLLFWGVMAKFSRRSWLSILLFGFSDKIWPKLEDINLDKISIFYCLNCFFECINGFRGTWIIQI